MQHPGPQQACCPHEEQLRGPSTHLLPLPAATRLDFKSVGEWFKMRLNQEEERQAVGQKRPAEEEAEGQPAPQRLASEGLPGMPINGSKGHPLGVALLACACRISCYKAVPSHRPAKWAVRVTMSCT